MLVTLESIDQDEWFVPHLKEIGTIVPRTFINFCFFPTCRLLIPDRTFIKFGPRDSKHYKIVIPFFKATRYSYLSLLFFYLLHIYTKIFQPIGLFQTVLSLIFENLTASTFIPACTFIQDLRVFHTAPRLNKHPLLHKAHVNGVTLKGQNPY